ncbi:MAG: hypothetical protein NC820_07810, partial [Candidatus Omnitrophica bacterium]|nr:hypothetical protein [Candidatus Omnitrophota bacterium]
MFFKKVLVFLSICVSCAFAQESITLTTYYPAPLGVYNRLEAQSLGVGDNNNDGTINITDVPNNPGDVWIRGNVGIGTTNPPYGFTISGGNGIDAGICNYSNISTEVSEWAVRRARGTEASPLKVENNDLLGAFSVLGFDGSAFRGTTVMMVAVDGPTGLNDIPTRTQFFTIPDGSVTGVERMRITNDGRVGIGTTNPPYGFTISGGNGIDAGICNYSNTTEVSEWAVRRARGT